jgi:hypothetical protein
MKIPEAVIHLQTTSSNIAMLVIDVDNTQSHWKPDENSWSILEVISHLADEEYEDFRLHLDLTLHSLETVLPSIDPKGWVKERAYNTLDPATSLDRFLSERKKSIEWLNTLHEPDWDKPCNHPQLKGLRAGDLLTSWIGHDLLHLRQITELRWLYLRSTSVPYTPDYAGEW